MAFCAKCGKELPAGATFCPNCGAPVEGAAATTTSTASTTTSSTPISGIDALTKDPAAQQHWVKRFAAIIIDYLIVFIPLIIISVVASIFLFFGGFGFYALLFGSLQLLFGLIFILYNAILENMWGASFGKRFMKIKVVSKTGGNPSIGEAFIRNLSKIYGLLLLLDVIVGLAVSKGYSQKYTDQLVGTKVTAA